MYLILPKGLYEAITRCELSRIRSNKVYSFLEEILSGTYNSMIYDNENTLTNGVEIKSKYLRKKYTSKYSFQFMDILLLNNIVKRTPFYSIAVADRYNGKPPVKEKAFGYYINPELVNFNEFVIVQYDDIPYKHSIAKKNIPSVVKQLGLLEYDIKGMLHELSRTGVTDIYYNEDITDALVEITTKNKSYRVKRDIAILEAKQDGKDLILYKNKYYIENKEIFLQQAQRKMILSQLYAISNLLNKKFHATICKSTHRLYNNLTNLKKIFIEKGYIKLQGEKIVDIDLCNSHPTLLGYLFTTNFKGNGKLKDLMKKLVLPDIDFTQPDVELFINCASNGSIYELLMKELGMERNKVKVAFLRTWYSKPLWPGADKRKICAVFPTVIKWIDDFKTLNKDYTLLSILLQKIEARIFVETIYPELQQLGYIVYTKHDSVLCKENMKPEVMGIMNEILRREKIAGRLK